MFGLWTFLLCCTGIAGIVLSAAEKRYRYGLISLGFFAPSYFLWQVAFNLYCFGAEQAAPISIRLGGIPWLFWFFALTLLTLIAALSLYLIIRRSKTYITPLAIKLCADRMTCGICCWRDNGHIIFSNDCMNNLCTALTGAPLMNGNHFRDAVSEGILSVADSVWSFTCRDLEFDGGPLHEMVASDVTEILAKADALRGDNEVLSRLNEELKAYSFKTDEAVRRQEILQAKVNIHDEMNRLMLSTVATDIENEEELNRIFALWERNALLLCFEADEKKDENAAVQIENLARALGVQLVWTTGLPENLTPKQRELFFTAAQEAIANAVKHGEAKNMKISFAQTESELCCCFENDGNIPKDDIHFTGGLSNLSILAGEQNASVAANTGETFRLYLAFSKNR